ncbi:reverse transcriptase domain-containing protein [Tanacetum coccineum]
MHTRASNSEIVEPLPEPERTLNRRLRRRNRRVPFDQRNNPPQHPRFVYPPILDINYFCHFLITLQNLYPMDDKPMWAADRVVAPTPGSAITIPETKTNLPLKHKDFQSRSKQSNLDDDDIPMSCEEEAKFMQTFSQENFDVLLDESSKTLHSIKGTILEENLFAEFNEFMVMTTDENSESESDTEEPPFEKITFNTDYKIKTSLEEPPTDLELKPLPDNLEYVFLEEPSFLPVIISSQLSKKDKNKLVYVLKKDKQAFAWKTTYIPRICPSFSTFQRCMLAIFHDMIEESVEVFMDDFSVFGSSFDHCLNNLDKMLQRCKDAHLVLNWEKCHFMVKEGIVLGHKVSEAGLEVDKAMIEVISKLPPPTNIKEFDIEIKDRKGTKNVAADHLSQIENEETSDDSEVDDNFPRETLMEIDTKDGPWFAYFANYLDGYSHVAALVYSFIYVVLYHTAITIMLMISVVDYMVINERIILEVPGYKNLVALDVFTVEPQPKENILVNHEKVTTVLYIILVLYLGSSGLKELQLKLLMLVGALKGRARCYYIIPLNMLVFHSLFDVRFATAVNMLVPWTNERPLENIDLNTIIGAWFTLWRD